MSDFLTNFQSGDYDKKNKKKEDVSNEDELVESQEHNLMAPEQEAQMEDFPPPLETDRRTKYMTEKTEIDPTYKRRRKRKLQLMLGTALFLVTASVIAVYQMTHIKMPNFQGRALSEVQTWATKNNITIVPKSDYSMKFDTNEIIKQPVKKNKKVRKGSSLTFKVSQGANPEEKLLLPDFSKLKEEKATEWLDKNRAENLSLVPEYSDDIQKGAYLRLELKEGKSNDNYLRKDNGTLYYSKGQEVFQKNITVPDFSGKTKKEIEDWAKTNEINVTYEEIDSSKIEAEKIISQSISPKEKVAKRDKMSVQISLGKAFIVPNFNDFTPESALTANKDLQVTVQKQFNPDVMFGQLISQSVESGSKLTSKDELSITLVYSEGRPYLKDYAGETEGNLQKLFYEDYQSKGANVYYQVNYVNSTEKKGTVVSMNAFNLYIPLNYTVTVNVSNGVA